MPLMDNPDFQRWLDKVESAHIEAMEGRPTSTQRRTRCDRCGDGLRADFDSATGDCLVCLAERFGRDQAEEAAYIGRVLTIALLSRDDVPLDVVRSVIEDVLDESASLADRA